MEKTLLNPQYKAWLALNDSTSRIYFLTCLPAGKISAGNQPRPHTVKRYKQLASKKYIAL